MNSSTLIKPKSTNIADGRWSEQVPSPISWGHTPFALCGISTQWHILPDRAVTHPPGIGVSEVSPLLVRISGL